jgi:flavodoxin I
MKVARTLIYKAIYYYSMTGNTKGLVDSVDVSGFDIYNLSQIKKEELNFDKYNVILFGTSTWGRGLPPRVFFNIRDELVKIHGKQIGLFGSGNTHYGEEFFCGALDLLEELLKSKNQILFKLKFESYPTKRVIDEFKQLLKECGL